MNHAKPIIVLAATLFFIVLVIPTLLVIPFAEKTSGELTEELQQGQKEETAQTPSGPDVEVAVYRTDAKKVEKLPLEDYVVGVVAAEMPAEFELEALKAQSLAARTFIVKHLMSDSDIKKPEGADVTDTVLDQVYKNDAELRATWGSDYKWKIEKIRKAVQETAGQILTYENNPISAQFFSTSNGYTENSEAYWSNPLPYLKSVESPWDKQSPKFTDQKVLTVKDFERKLGVKLSEDGSMGKIIGRTPGKRVKEVEINGEKLSGKQVRENLDLPSTDFNWTRKGDQIVITTKGYGHGVGMSQYGANGMAEEGKTYKEIVLHYYKGISITPSDQYAASLTAKK